MIFMNKSNKFNVTMILLSYNQEDYIKDSLLSLLAQDSDKIEIYISDDFSTDNTVLRINEVLKDYNGPHHITIDNNKKNLGLISNLNKCFKKASGEIIIVCAGDDISHISRARLIKKEFISHNPLLVFSNFDILSLNTKKQIECQDIRPSFHKSLTLEENYLSMAMFVGATGAYHKDIFDKYGYLPDTNCYEDLILGFRALLENRIIMIDKELIKYRLGGLSNSGNRKERYLKSYDIIKSVAHQRIIDISKHQFKYLRYKKDINKQYLKALIRFELFNNKVSLRNLVKVLFSNPRVLLSALNAKIKMKFFK